AEDGIRDRNVTGVQTCALPISPTLDERSFFVCITKLCSGVSSSNHANGTSNSFEILDKVAIAEDVCPFSILDSKLLDIPHSSAISCCVFCCLYLIFFIFIFIFVHFLF